MLQICSWLCSEVCVVRLGLQGGKGSIFAKNANYILRTFDTKQFLFRL